MSDIMSNNTPQTSLSSPFPFAKQHKKKRLQILQPLDFKSC